MAENPTPEMNEAADALARAFADSWNRQDGVGYGAAYWPDAELVDPTATIWDGQTAIAQMHVDLWQGPARGTGTLEGRATNQDRLGN